MLKRPYLSYFSTLIITLLLGCYLSTKIDHIESSYFELGDSLYKDEQSITDIISPYKKGIDSLMDEVLNQSETDLIKAQPESPLGNFVADICYTKGNEYYHPTDNHFADFCVLNNGGLRASIPKGDVTLRNIYELMPFENRLVVLTLSGSATYQLFAYINQSGGVPISNARFKLTPMSPVSIEIANILIDTTHSYKVLTSDYLAGGGDKMHFFNNPINFEVLDIKIRDAIIEYCKELKRKGQLLSADYDGRIYTDK